MWYVASQFAVS